MIFCIPFFSHILFLFLFFVSLSMYCGCSSSISISRHTDFSLLYNPLIYPNSLFWPPTFFLPYQNAAAAVAVAGLTASPESPNLSNHRYTLTPEKDEAVGKLFSFRRSFDFCVFMRLCVYATACCNFA